MPVSPPCGKPLIVVARLVETDSLAIPSNVVMDSLWVVNGEDTWATVSGERRSRQPDQIEEVARGGPKWGPGITVDVGVRVRTGSEEAHHILATNQRIDRTDSGIPRI